MAGLLSALGNVGKRALSGYGQMQLNSLNSYKNMGRWITQSGPKAAENFWYKTFARGPGGTRLPLFEPGTLKADPTIMKRLIVPGFAAGVGIAALQSRGPHMDEPGMVAPYGNMDAMHPASMNASGSMVFAMRDRAR